MQYKNMTNTQLFIKFLENLFVDFDGAWGDQCVDLVQQYNKVVIGGPFLTGQAAKDIWETYPRDFYERITNAADNYPQQGDIVIWGKDYGPSGHIAICISVDVNRFSAFSQNDPTGARSIVREYKDYYGVLGWLRPKQFALNIDVEMTEQQKKDIESMTKLRAYNGVWYESQDVIRDYEALKSDKRKQEEAWSIERASLKQNIANRDETISRLEKQVLEPKKAWDTDHEALIKTITDSEKGIATLKDAIGTLEKRLKNEEAERHALATINAELEAKNAGLLKQISEGAIVDYKSLALKERIKICVDIIFA